jgi:hypothetical protein
MTYQKTHFHQRAGDFALASVLILLGAVIAIAIPLIGLGLIGWAAWSALTVGRKRRRADEQAAAKHRQVYGW